jgi:ferredoxin-nitrate reductase
MNAEDAETMGLKDGELVVVRSRRGVLEVPLKIGEIEHGQVFVPFHYGAMSNEGAKSQSANDLTQ